MLQAAAEDRCHDSKSGARKPADVKKDLARKLLPSDGLCTRGEAVFVWNTGDNKNERGRLDARYCSFPPGCYGKRLIGVNQSRARRDRDELHDPQPAGFVSKNQAQLQHPIFQAVWYATTSCAVTRVP